ncbi:sensor histidine kinase [Gloeothece verrucosa]|uniref:histidine kinase n=1 Tax=Gloeothece verrucosa (strain PCC 7822) TaxID=497965 RepID=E0UC23_GLOV7|nr:HAMP domain-containing sensor histidine kinase [Gloeothece verrucosa]ADN16361.1 histidine kinase [Gloeothece verrucosa PCC 7822]
MNHRLSGETTSHFKLVNFNFFLELQFKQLSEEIPIVFALLVYQDCPKKSTAFFAREFHSFEISSEEISLFSSELDVQNLGAFFKVTQMGEYESKYIYFCPLSQKNFITDYLFFLSETILSRTEEESIEIHAQIIQEYLNLYQVYHQQNEEIKSLEHLIHKIGHELRNPLSLISLMAENLRLSLAESQQKQVVSLQETITNLNQNLNQLIDCSKRARLKLELCDLRYIVRKSIQSLNPIVESKAVSLQYPQDKEAIIAVDYLQIQQVFGNLFSNAIYFSPVGGKILCNWQFFQKEIIVTITDQGQGLSPQDLKNIFTPFYSRRPGGTGLGLTIVQKIIMDHGGRIWAENLVLGGTKFTFTLPR